MTNGTTFKTLRKNIGYTTECVADKLGIKVATYRKYECFNRLPGTDILTHMAEIYKCSFDEVVQAYKNAKEVQIKRYGKTNP
ncbi:MAG: helix-turn-helix domain-containing protein [Clostridiaceae bacterium]